MGTDNDVASLRTGIPEGASALWQSMAARSGTRTASSARDTGRLQGSRLTNLPAALGTGVDRQANGAERQIRMMRLARVRRTSYTYGHVS